jgi:hypothetical protein
MRGPDGQEREFLGGEEGVTMASHEFVLRLNREVTDEDVVALYEAGCADASVETGPLGTMPDFTRKATTLAEALVSAVRDIEKVPGLRVIGVASDNMVTLAGVADRAGVTREAVRLWSTGQRGRGGFPPPLMMTAAGERVWDWQQVGRWLERNEMQLYAAAWAKTTMTVRTRTLCTADRVLAARDALRDEPDELVREEFERLLEDA